MKKFYLLFPISTFALLAACSGSISSSKTMSCTGGFTFGDAPYAKDDKGISLVISDNKVEVKNTDFFQKIKMISCKDANGVLSFGDKDCDSSNMQQNQVGNYDPSTKALVVKNITFRDNAKLPIVGEYTCSE